MRGAGSVVCLLVGDFLLLLLLAWIWEIWLLHHNPHPFCTRTRQNNTHLTSCIPNLKFNSLPINLDVLDLEVDPNRGDKSGGEGVIGVPEEEAGLANARVADH